MIHSQGWAFLGALPSYAACLAIEQELMGLRDSGDSYMRLATRLTGVMCLCAAALITAVFLEHTALSQVGFVVAGLAWGWRAGTRDKFEREWRRISFLQGYTTAQLGKSPYPDG